jgi:GrpB-like predicted nucleotidyltransferase (UPF0157 family)
MVTRRAAFAEHWERLLFRDYLISHPASARQYEQLKISLAATYPNDRTAYTKGKSMFIKRTTVRAKKSVAAPSTTAG